ncbi:MAG TPA: hypothetical protein VLT61_12180 [Anaeromyxobacteraceae bacterium]|nr:hypothetical protein [Anaeromyxobacteraceae bacterium]
MSAITTSSGQIRGEKLLPEIGSLYASPSSTYYPGGLVGHMPGSNLAVPVTAGASPDLIIVGVTTSYLVTGATVDGNGIALDADGMTKLYVAYEDGLIGYFDTGTSTHAITDSNRDAPCWAFDNNTLYLDNPGGLLPFAGIIHHVDADGSVHVFIRASSGAPALFAPAEGGATATYDDSAAYVATNLPAGAFSGGVYTATSAGAFSTAQDGQTPALNDKIMVPAGTIGSLTVAVQDSGLYYVSSLGGASAKMTLSRTPSYQHGAVITPQQKVRVQFGTLFGGSTWTAEPATAAKKVGNGTDDPRWAPDKVTQQITLASGTFSITNVPIRDAARVGASFTVAGGTPAATTTSFQAKLTSGIAAGGVGTGAIVVEAQSVVGTKVNTDVTVLNATIIQ